MSYAAKNQQTSFIFSVNNEGILVNKCWEKLDPDMPYHKNTNPYVKRLTDSSVVVNVDNANCCSEKIGNFQISIPLSVINQIDDNLNVLKSEGKITDKEVSLTTR